MRRPKIQTLRDRVKEARKLDMKSSANRGFANGLITALSIMVPGEVFCEVEKPKAKKTTKKPTKKTSKRR